MSAHLTPGRRLGLVAGVTMVLFFAVRLPILLFEPDWGTTEMDQFGLFAAHAVSGLLGPPSEYLPQPHQGCTFVFGAWCAPIIALGDPQIGSLRLCSLTLHAAIALVFVVLAGRLNGWRSGAAAGALFVFAPPMLAHYAQKGSTNHDDCDLFVGLALLLLVAPGATGRSREALVRATGAGTLVGVAAGYMLDGGMRGLVVLGLALLLGEGRLRRAAAMAGGLILSLGVFLLLGVSDGEDGVVRKAISRGTLWAEDRSGIEMTAPLSERLHQLLDFALPTGFRVSGPDLWGLVPMSEPVLLYAYPLLLLLLAGVGLLGRRGLDSTDVTSGPSHRLLVTSCLLIPIVQCAAVVLAGLEVEVDYIAPIWPYLVVLAAAGLAPGAKVGSGTRMGVSVAALSIALLLCFEGMHWKLDAFYRGASDEESDTWQQSRFAGSLRAARPERHAFGPRLIDRERSAGLRQLLDDRATERVSLARMLGQATALELADAACGPDPKPPRRLAADLPEASRALFFEGIGEQVMSSPDPCRWVQGGPADVGWSGPLGEALRTSAGPYFDDVVRGAAFGQLERMDGQFTGAEEGYPAGPARRAMCVAAGSWAFVTMRPVELMEWLDPAGACKDEELAVGWAIAVARDRWPKADEATPDYRWWWPDASTRARTAFSCAWREESARVAAMTSGAAWSPGPPCLPTP